jgi:uncharacterized RDD family membrane protein YckC
VTKTCLQCGAVLPSSAGVCNFCDSSFSVDFSGTDEASGISRPRISTTNPTLDHPSIDHSVGRGVSSRETGKSITWQGELAQRLETYRTRRRKVTPNAAQSRFSFDEGWHEAPAQPALAVAETPPSKEEDFSFTIAIGRPSKKRVLEESRMVIDVSLTPESETASAAQAAGGGTDSQSDRHPVACIDDRRLAALIDLGCLLFAYGGFLALFGSLGGQFTLSKLSAAVYATTFAIVYLQYFALFTVFGGTTPGMMMRGLQVTSFSGEQPTPKQMFLRSAGYMLSAGTFFLGFLWAMWDEDELTWHDRLSHTYLSKAQSFADLESSGVVHSQ